VRAGENGRHEGWWPRREATVSLGDRDDVQAIAGEARGSRARRADGRNGRSDARDELDHLPAAKEGDGERHVRVARRQLDHVARGELEAIVPQTEEGAVVRERAATARIDVDEDTGRARGCGLRGRALRGTGA
jgi:hypothetical protein